MMLITKTLKKYSDRLLNEWIKHGKIIIALDFDNTIYPFGDFDNTNEILETIDLVKQCQLVGCYVVIHTSCDKSRYDEIKKYCIEKGIEISSINTNPIPLKYGNEGKVYANIYLDDRAGLPYACGILKIALEKYKKTKNI